MIRTKRNFLLIVSLIFLMTGCGSFENPKAEESGHIADSQTEELEVMNPTKVYKMVASDQVEELSLPGLSIDEEHGTFTFTYDLLSSYLNAGTYTISNNVLKATSDDGKYQYLFSVVDEDTLVFLQSGSSDVSLIDERLGVPIEDGAIFKRCG